MAAAANPAAEAFEHIAAPAEQDITDVVRRMATVVITEQLIRSDTVDNKTPETSGLPIVTRELPVPVDPKGHDVHQEMELLIEPLEMPTEAPLISEPDITSDNGLFEMTQDAEVEVNTVEAFDTVFPPGDNQPEQVSVVEIAPPGSRDPDIVAPGPAETIEEASPPGQVYIRSVESNMPEPVIEHIMLLLDERSDDSQLVQGGYIELITQPDVLIEPVDSLEAIRQEAQRGLPLEQAVLQLGQLFMQERQMAELPNTVQELDPDRPGQLTGVQPETVGDVRVLESIITEIADAYAELQAADPEAAEVYMLAKRQFASKLAVFCNVVGYSPPDETVAAFLQHGELPDLMQGILCLQRLIKDEEYKEIRLYTGAAVDADTDGALPYPLTLLAWIGRTLLWPPARDTQAL